MKLIFLIVLIGISSRMCCHGDDLALVAKCFKVYQTTLLERKTFEGHCSRIQAILNCLLEKPDERGKVLDSFRYSITQDAMFDSKLGLCPSFKFVDELKALVKNTDVAQKHRLIDDLGEDHFEPCASDVQRAVLEHYFSSLGDHDVCRDINEDYSQYFKIKAKELGCHAKILDHYISVLSVSTYFITEIKKHIGFACKI